MLWTTQQRQRALIIGVRFILSVCSSWVQSAPATAALPYPTAVIAHAVEGPVRLVFSVLVADKKIDRAMSVRRVADRH